MGRFDTPDIDITGQLSMENYDVAASGLFAMSRIFARARRDMSLSEQKAFVRSQSSVSRTGQKIILFA